MGGPQPGISVTELCAIIKGVSGVAMIQAPHELPLRGRSRRLRRYPGLTLSDREATATGTAREDEGIARPSQHPAVLDGIAHGR